VQMQNKFFNGVDRRVILRIRVYIVSVEINTIFISSIMSTIHSIRIDNRHQVKYKFLTE
jgi:hypothetical protein